jgi:hypothetical protein
LGSGSRGGKAELGIAQRGGTEEATKAQATVIRLSRSLVAPVGALLLDCIGN